MRVSIPLIFETEKCSVSIGIGSFRFYVKVGAGKHGLYELTFQLWDLR